ncbi:MAG: hypothetical protein AAF483_26195 [Planctomycetota bacterium]
MPNRENESTKRRKLSWKTRLGILAGLLLVFVFFLPKILTTRTVLNYAIDNYAGLGELQLEYQAVHAGWMSPVEVHGIKLLKADGSELVAVASVQTQKGLLGWATDSSNLGHVVIDQVAMAINTDAGTSNIEQALEPLLQELQSVPSESASESTPTQMQGTVELRNCEFQLRARTSNSQWLAHLPKAVVTLPGPNQVMGPIDFQLEVQKQSSADEMETMNQPTGVIAAQVQQTEVQEHPEFEIRAKLQDFPLGLFEVARERLPELPVDEMQGRVSGVLAGKAIDENAWTLLVTDLQASSLLLNAPDLLGKDPASLQVVAGTARCSVQDGWLTCDNTKIQCDFANASAEAKIPWPIPSTTMAKPLIAEAEYQAKGVVDLPKLVQAAKSLIPVRADTRITSGKLNFEIAQNQTADKSSFGSASLKLEGLKGQTQGQQLEWKEPLSVYFAAKQGIAGLELSADTTADFVNLKANGRLEDGQITADLNLSKLHQRLSQFVELPIQQMSGSVSVRSTWKLNEESIVRADGSLNSTALSIATKTGKQLEEQAWQGVFRGDVRLENSLPSKIENLALNLQSPAERIVVNLQQPLELRTATAENPVNPAAFSVDLQLDLAKCNRRGTVWLSEPTGIDVGGTLQLAANGKLDLDHVEVLDANWNGQPIQVFTDQLRFSEPRVVGKFRGRFDSSNITRTIVDTLELTSSSVSLIAQDQADEDGRSRLGRAKFIADLGRLLSSTETGSTGLVPELSELNADPVVSQISASGLCEGELAWRVNSTAAGLNLNVTGKDLFLVTKTNNMNPETLWHETTATANLQGTWQAESNAIDFTTVSLSAPWVNYAGTCKYNATEDGQSAELKGQAVYDAGRLSQKLMPYTGGQLAMAGQKEVPINVTWTDKGESASLLAGLNASTRIGWQSAYVAGIEVGMADVPIEVTSGVARSATEIAVSGGVLRWDLESDLTQDEFIIHQKPMTMLDNVAMTQQMCSGWLKYVTPLLAEATSVDGRLSLTVSKAELNPAKPEQQTVVGQLAVHNATVGPGPLSASVIGIVDQVEALRKQDFTRTVSSTQKVWMNMKEQKIDFQMINGQVTHKNLSVDIGDATVSTRGTVAVGGAMSMVAAMPIPDDWAEKSQWLGGLRGQVLEFPMGGTITNPQVDSRLLSQIGRQTLQNAASGALQQGLNRGIDKLLGDSNNPLGDLLKGPALNVPGQQSGQTLPPGGVTPNNSAAPANSGLRGLGQQILQGQGLNIPGLFGGQAPPNNNP